MKLNPEQIDELLEAPGLQAPPAPDGLGDRILNRYRRVVRIERRNNLLSVAAMLTLLVLNVAFLLTQFGPQEKSLAEAANTEVTPAQQVYNDYFDFTSSYNHE